MISCKNCSSNKTVRNGHTKGGNQRYQCKNCGYRFTSDTDFKRNDSYFIVKAIELWLEGLNYSMISSILLFTPETISKWLKPYEQLLSPIRQNILKMEELKIVRNNNMLLGLSQKGTTLPTHVSGVLIVGVDSEVWGVSKRATQDYGTAL